MSADPKSTQAACVLVVDDEPVIREMVTLHLGRDGLDVLQAESGPEALEIMSAAKPDAVVLDIMLPGMDGLEVCRKIREKSNVPILLLSARGEEFDRVLGLELGADDYLTKPFAVRELVARVRAMLRRMRMIHEPEEAASEAVPESAPESNHQTLRAGDIVVDVAGREATVDGEPLSLKPKEFDLLVYFMRHPGVAMTREALLREVWGYEYRVDTRTVDVHIRWLRKKLEEDPSDPDWILTVRGHGYRFVVPDGQ